METRDITDLSNTAPSLPTPAGGKGAVHTSPAVQTTTELPGEHHKGLSVIRTGAELRRVGLHHSQAQLEHGLDALGEEAVQDTEGTGEGQHTEEQGEEPGQGQGRQRRQVRALLRQLGETLADQLLKHRLVHLGTCRGHQRSEVAWNTNLRHGHTLLCSGSYYTQYY